jgi:hypothetical protein
MHNLTHIWFIKLETNFVSKLKFICLTAILPFRNQFSVHRLVVVVDNITNVFVAALSIEYQEIKPLEPQEILHVCGNDLQMLLSNYMIMIRTN